MRIEQRYKEDVQGLLGGGQDCDEYSDVEHMWGEWNGHCLSVQVEWKKEGIKYARKFIYNEEVRRVKRCIYEEKGEGRKIIVG